MKTKIAISSHVKFYEKTYAVLVPSLLSAGVPAEDIYFFIGGCGKYEQVPDADVNVWQTDHNSIDFTGLVSVVDLNLRSDRWFLLHDTLYVGPNFYRCIQNKPSTAPTVNLSRLYSKNMGSYAQTYLDQIKPTLLSKYKNTSTDPVVAHQFKTMNVDTENCFLTNEEFFTVGQPTIVADRVDFYQSNNLRSVQYYPDIDVFKVQSCVNHPGNYNMTI